MKKILFFGVLLASSSFANDACFIAMDQTKVIQQQGNCVKRHPPCSTFKIAISLMGYDEGILKDVTHPQWNYKEGYPNYIESWKQPQNPTTWIRNSCVWYSQVITKKIGMTKFKHYVYRFNYGNQDVSGDQNKNNGLTQCWISSSLKISGKEQVEFLRRLLAWQLPVKKSALQYTHDILYVEALPRGWNLYGKTGSCSETNDTRGPREALQIGWFVGWAQKGLHKVIFANYIEEKQTNIFLGKKARALAKNKILKIITKQY